MLLSKRVKLRSLSPFVKIALLTVSYGGSQLYLLNISLLLLHLCLSLSMPESLLRKMLQSLFLENCYCHPHFDENQLNLVCKTCLDSRRLPCRRRIFSEADNNSHQARNLMNNFMKFSLLLKTGCITKIETEKQVSVPKIFVHLLMVEEIFLNFLFSTLLYLFLFPIFFLIAWQGILAFLRACWNIYSLIIPCQSFFVLCLPGMENGVSWKSQRWVNWKYCFEKLKMFISEHQEYYISSVKMKNYVLKAF